MTLAKSRDREEGEGEHMQMQSIMRFMQMQLNGSIYLNFQIIFVITLPLNKEKLSPLYSKT